MAIAATQTDPEIDTEIVGLAAEMQQLGRRAKAAARDLALASTETKNAALRAGATALRREVGLILQANAEDVADGRARGLSEALLDRLALSEARVEAMASGLEQIAALPDPVGRIDAAWDRPNGLAIERVRVPIGVIGIIYESRPNVTADAGALCLKSGNAAILRGGSESARSAKAILSCLAEGLRVAGLPQAAIQAVPTQDREAVGMLLQMDETIDLIVPRGGRSLIERVLGESRIPVLKHLDGICHVYVDAAADGEKARRIVLNAKMRRTGICGSAETLLVARAVAATALPTIAAALLEAGCELRGDAETRALVPQAIAATEADWSTEYLAPILAIRIVADVAEAIAHINRYGSHHTDAIVTEDAASADRFTREVDSAIVLINASTQFADGGEFGMGAEIGISTGKLHARGPVGVAELTTYKYVVRGTGQLRA